MFVHNMSPLSKRSLHVVEQRRVHLGAVVLWRVLSCILTRVVRGGVVSGGHVRVNNTCCGYHAYLLLLGQDCHLVGSVVKLSAET